jgi:CRP/FNR family transcriptional regulator, cyclic AMP receptor protein
MSNYIRQFAAAQDFELAGGASPLRHDHARLFGERGWLSQQSPAFQRDILAMARLVQAKRGEWIFAVNDPPGGIYGVISGGIGIEGSGPYNLPRLGHVLRRGSWLGHGPILSGGGRRVQGMRALEDSELVYVPLAALRQLIGEDPEAARRVGQMADGGSQLATRVVSDLLIPSVPQQHGGNPLRN